MDHKHGYIDYKIQNYIEAHSFRLNIHQLKLITLNYKNCKLKREKILFLNLNRKLAI